VAWTCALRFAVLLRQRSGGTRTDHGDRYSERLLAVRETCRLQGCSLHHYVTTWPSPLLPPPERSLLSRMPNCRRRTRALVAVREPCRRAVSRMTRR